MAGIPDNTPVAAAQATRGIYSVLSPAWIYRAFQTLVGAHRRRMRIASDHVRAVEHQRVLNIGCGTGEILDYLPRVQYVGYDLSPKYIEAAQRRYGERGIFHVGDVHALEISDDMKFDIVLAFGLLHHLSDEDTLRLMRLARDVLGQGGRFVSVDPTFVESQSWPSRLLIKSDRGRHVRREEELRELAETRFSDIRSTVRHDLIRLPYTHVILECRS